LRPDIRGRNRVREQRQHGSVRGAEGNPTATPDTDLLQRIPKWITGREETEQLFR